MRLAQKEYFRTRTTTSLKATKHLEKRFDEEVEHYLHPDKQLCFEDFNSLPMDIFDTPLEPIGG